MTKAPLFVAVLTAAGMSMPTVVGALRQQDPRPGAGLSIFKTHAIDPILELGSPDGKWAIYRKDDAPRTVWLRELATKRDRELVTFTEGISRLAWSLDSHHIAFSVGDWAVHVIGVSDGADRLLAMRGAVVCWGAGSEVLIQQLRPSALVLAPAGGEEAKVVPTAVAQSDVVAITPDGRTLITRRTDTLGLYDIDTRVTRELVRLPGARFPVVSPDGKLVAFYAGGSLYVVPIDAAPVRNPVRVAERLSTLDPSPVEVATIWWTADGQLVVPNIVNDTGNLYRVDMDPKTGHSLGPVRLLLRNADYPVVSPDGKQIAHSRSSRGNALEILDVSAGTSRQFLVGSATAGQVLGWRSPSVVVLSGQQVVTTFDLRTGTQASHFNDKGVNGYAAARDEVLLTTEADRTSPSVLKARALSTGVERTIATVDHLGEYRVSSDGRFVAYGRRLGPDPDAKGELRVIGSDGQGDRLLLSTQKGSDPAAWSPDGKWLLFVDWSDWLGDASVRVVEIATGRSWLLLEAKDLPDWWDGYAEATWAPDGSFVVLSGGLPWKDPVGKVFEGVTYAAIAKLIDPSRVNFNPSGPRR